MNDKPLFDDIEAPEVVTTPIDGMTDGEWAARNERQGKIIRRVFAGAIGLAVGLVATSELALTSPLYVLASWLVIFGVMLYVIALAERHDGSG